MLKIVHLLTGAAALLLSFIPSLRSDALPYLQQADALYLGLFGLFNLLYAPEVTQSRERLQNLVSVLLVFAVALQTMILLAPMPLIGTQPAALFAFLAITAAVALNLILNLQQNRAYSQPAPQDLGDRETGTVKWFNTSKGFGFISRDSGDDIFVHFRAIRGEGHRVLVEGQRVEFAVMQRDKGLQAEDVIAALPSRR
ncbi:MAG: cold-shock protein [Pseudomonadales bacterium RIFCSPLOWO2_12_59_9]|nr:MAG: cold-shock protein [Pseudomonadales bacterium RIFCSPLOWO2_12_59_9]